jgi:hypothetical protein
MHGATMKMFIQFISTINIPPRYTSNGLNEGDQCKKVYQYYSSSKYRVH